MAVRYPNSYQKTLAQISVVARVPVVVSESMTYLPPATVKVTESFWRKYGCYLQCGGCCPAFTLDYLPDEWERFCEAYPDYAERGAERLVSVNGEQFPIMTIDNAGAPERFGKQWCQFVDLSDGRCTIHEANPFSCRIELIKFRRVKEVGYMLKAPFGRAWNMARVVDGEHDILCDFAPFDATQFIENDLPRLRQMTQWAAYFSIPTLLPQIIDTLLVAHEQQRYTDLVFTQ